MLVTWVKTFYTVWRAPSSILKQSSHGYDLIATFLLKFHLHTHTPAWTRGPFWLLIFLHIFFRKVYQFSLYWPSIPNFTAQNGVFSKHDSRGIARVTLIPATIPTTTTTTEQWVSYRFSFLVRRFNSYRTGLRYQHWAQFHCFGTPIWRTWRHENSALF